MIFSPHFSDRLYNIESRPDVATGSYSPVSVILQGDNGQVRTVTDTNATDAIRFYRIGVTLP